APRFLSFFATRVYRSVEGIYSLADQIGFMIKLANQISGRNDTSQINDLIWYINFFKSGNGSARTGWSTEFKSAFQHVDPNLARFLIALEQTDDLVEARGLELRVVLAKLLPILFAEGGRRILSFFSFEGFVENLEAELQRMIPRAGIFGLGD